MAEAEAETAKKVSDAGRDAAVVQADNAVKVASAEKDRDIKRAQFKVEADNENAKAEKAMAIATAAQDESLKIAEAKRDEAEQEAQTSVEAKRAKRKEQELVATVIKQAEAEKNASIIRAEGEKQAHILNAEAQKEVSIREAEGKSAATAKEGEGHAQKMKFEASGTQATMEAEAAGNKAKLLAEADGDKAKLLAKAEGDAAQKGKVLLAEAEGTAKLAEALAKMTESGRLIIIMDRLPQLLEKGGEATAKALEAMFKPVAEGLGNIDNITITDIGGTGRGVSQVGNIVPEVVFKALSGLSARGIDLAGILEKIGINPEEMLKIIGLEKDKTIEAETTPTKEKAETEKKED